MCFYIANWGTVQLLFKYHKNEEGFGWTEGEGILPDLLPLYEEIKSKNYQILKLISAVNDEFTRESDNSLEEFISTLSLTSAQKAFLQNIAVESKCC